MKKKFLLNGWLLLVTVLMVGFSSCSNDDGPGGSGNGGNPEQLLIGKWRPVKALGDNVASDDLFGSMVDDVLEFKANKTVTYDENGTFYGYNLTQSFYPSQSTWTLKYDSELWKAWVLNIKGDGVFFFAANFEVVKVDNNTLIIDNGFEYEFKRIN